jgi:hypothetical protein
VVESERLPSGSKHLVGICSLFSGIGLLLNVLAGVSLPLALAATTLALAVMVGTLVRAASARGRRWLRTTALLGAAAGFIATLTYDVSKSLLSILDPSPYNPFEVIRVFGALLIGESQSSPLVVLAGGLFHLLNGTAFGVAYTFLFARSGRTSPRFAVLSGAGWGVFLETFQLTLYPGWLDIAFYQEFATISAVSHLVYGATLGVVSRTLLTIPSQAGGLAATSGLAEVAHDDER